MNSTTAGPGGKVTLLVNLLTKLMPWLDEVNLPRLGAVLRRYNFSLIAGLRPGS